MFHDAVRVSASDIHIEAFPGKIKTKVRLRKDGVCHEYTELPHGYTKAVVNRIKIISGLSVDQHFLPQTGRQRFGSAVNVFALVFVGIDDRFHHLPVTREGRLIGMITASDILGISVEGVPSDVRSMAAAVPREMAVTPVMMSAPMAERLRCRDWSA